MQQIFAHYQPNLCARGVKNGLKQTQSAGVAKGMEGTSHETSTDPAGTQTLLADVGSDLKDNSDDDSLKCKVCNKCYKQKPSVIKHMINIHGIENLEKKYV